LGYVVLVYLIFFITYTPISVDHVRGVQGRYFLIALPPIAIFLAAMINLALPRGAPAMAAIAGGVLSGIATINALFEAHWLQPHQ
jgi:4-amino-4-deoxy-L-arabinose transferase-like glycosyltransferase